MEEIGRLFGMPVVVDPEMKTGEVRLGTFDEGAQMFGDALGQAAEAAMKNPLLAAAVVPENHEPDLIVIEPGGGCVPYQHCIHCGVAMAPGPKDGNWGWCPVRAEKQRKRL